MHEQNPEYKRSATKYDPKGLTILYEDRDIIVIDKEPGLLTISTANEKEKTAYFLLNEYVRKGNYKSKNRVFIVHRLDRDTSGVLVFAKNEEVKRFLQDNWKEFSKNYYAVINGHLPQAEGLITSYLAENKVNRMYSVRDPEMGKLSETGFKVIDESRYFSLLEIYLYTGTKNQIRVQFSELGNPVVGDKAYGKDNKGIKRLALHSASLTISHPFTKKLMTFEANMPSYFNYLLSM